MQGLATLGWDAFVAIVAGSSVLTTVGIYLLARFTGAFDTYAAERAKLLAQAHAIDVLIEQTKALTATAEIIKGRVTDQVWDRQTRWTYKRDVYVGLIQSIGGIRTGLARVKVAFKAELEGKQWAGEVATTGQRQAEAANDEFVRGYDVAPLVVSTRAYKILSDVLTRFKSARSEAEVQLLIDSLKGDLDLLQAEARSDLGYEPISREA